MVAGRFFSPSIVKLWTKRAGVLCVSPNRKAPITKIGMEREVHRFLVNLSAVTRFLDNKINIQDKIESLSIGEVPKDLTKISCPVRSRSVTLHGSVQSRCGTPHLLGGKNTVVTEIRDDMILFTLLHIFLETGLIFLLSPFLAESSLCCPNLLGQRSLRVLVGEG